MSWWLTNLARAKSERVALAELAERAEWMSGVRWRIGDDLQLIVDFDIQHHAETFGFFMLYPSTFPHTPPMVLSRDRKRLSWHQYGPDRELCLEYRPDNWDSSITGAMMVESAYRLLSGERPAEGEVGVVPSAHQTSIGRQTRGEIVRFVIARDALEALASLPMDNPVPITAWDRFEMPTWVASLISVGAESSTIWSQSKRHPSGSTIEKGFAFRTTRNIDRFRTGPMSFAETMSVEFPDIFEQLPEIPFNGILLLGDDNGWVALRLFSREAKQAVYQYKVIEAPDGSNRLPAYFSGLANKRVAIVGCGSVGSKIGTGLARSGVLRFTLVDADLFFDGNLVRNDLDARAIGWHKVDALTVRIKDINADTEISGRRVALGQQESAGTTESVMEELAQADLLIDATADRRAFNLTAATAHRHLKPVVWCEVFAGGIGGIVARARPDLDPVPQVARRQIQAWCDAHGMPWSRSGDSNYEARSESGFVLIADDAEVAVIASHATRFALDILTREQSIFPSSAYLIGLKPEWIFQAPFDTWPIDLRPEGEWGERQYSASVDEVRDFLSSLSAES